jgi:hypothetical protein
MSTYQVRREDGSQEILTREEMLALLDKVLDRSGMVMWFEKGKDVKLVKEENGVPLLSRDR